MDGLGVNEQSDGHDVLLWRTDSDRLYRFDRRGPAGSSGKDAFRPWNTDLPPSLSLYVAFFTRTGFVSTTRSRSSAVRFANNNFDLAEGFRVRDRRAGRYRSRGNPAPEKVDRIRLRLSSWRDPVGVHRERLQVH